MHKPQWTKPSLTVIVLKDALGANNGSKCDKFGSLSEATANDRCDPATK